ncbi:MAG: LpqB family beta-propeller domain-containing protein [Nakamurella sp.]
MTGFASVRARLVGRGIAAVSIVLVAASCASMPTSGSAHVVRRVVDESVAAAPQGPDPGQQPEQIVREFIHASAMTEYDTAGESFVVARQFLTPSAEKLWHADSGSTRIVVLADDFSAVPDAEDPAAVTITGRQIGTVEPDRSFQPIDSVSYRATIYLDKSADQWRIANPPDNVLITRSEFSTALRQRTVYFLDSTGRVVVPDIRYIPNSPTPSLSVNRLMDLLLHGPSEQLTGAARTQLGPGAALQSNVRIDAAGVAHVDLEGVDVSTPAARQALAAQIVWTLDPDVQQIEISVNGLPLTVAGATPASSATDVFSLSSGTVANFDPDVVPGSAQAVSDAYYVDGGVILRLSDSTPMWGSVGTGSVRVTSAALSAASGALAAVASDGDGGSQLLVGKPFDHQPVVTALKANTLTQPSFTRWGYAAWTVQNGASQPEVYQVAVASGTPTWSRVTAPGLAKLGPVTALELSPDGVRVAVVADGKLYLGVVVSAPDAAGDKPADDSAKTASDDRQGLTITGIHELRGDLSDVGPVTWDDSVNLLVGAKTIGSAHRTVFRVSVDGQSVDAVTTSQVYGDVFGDVDSIASADSGLPMLISFGSRIWQLQGSESSGQWVPPNGGNWMPGIMPFYPN